MDVNGSMKRRTEAYTDYVTALIFVLAFLAMAGVLVYAVTTNRGATVALCEDSRLQATVDIAQDERLISLLRSAIIDSDNQLFIADSKDAILEMQVETRRLRADAEKDC